MGSSRTSISGTHTPLPEQLTGGGGVDIDAQLRSPPEATTPPLPPAPALPPAAASASTAAQLTSGGGAIGDTPDATAPSLGPTASPVSPPPLAPAPLPPRSSCLAAVSMWLRARTKPSAYEYARERGVLGYFFPRRSVFGSSDANATAGAAWAMG